MLELTTREEMQREEREACERYGVSTLLLMENAGRGIASEILSVLRNQRNLRAVSIVCGTGNNGGDGMVVARHLLVEGVSPRVYLVGSPEVLRGDARYNYEVLMRLGLPVHVVAAPSDFVVERGTLVVDALFGTGLTREITGIHREVIRAINAAEDVFVVAVDVPSGVDASDGRILGEAVRAHLTVTLGLVKRGLVLFPGRAYVGKLKLHPIGIPLRGCGGKLVFASDIRRLLPRKPWFAHKISSGVVGIVAGSSGMLGAGILVALGACRSGAGMVVWPLPPEFSVAVKACVPEVVHIPLSLSSSLWHYDVRDLESIFSGFEARKVSSVVVGPGLGMHEGIERFLKEFLALAPVKGVLDADGLNVIARDRERWEGKLAGWVVTPHFGEAARLLGWSVQEVTEQKVQAVQEIARYFGCVAVLKGPGTLIASPQGEIFVNPTGNELLATAGSGDVLAGLIGGFLAQGLDPLSGALCGVFLHGLVADLLQEEGRKSLLAHEIAVYVDVARKVVDDGTWRFSLLDGNFPGEFGP
ncbi:MAG: NAD(P)H-hydrate dehydratase [Atribacterota bacterium]